MLKKNVDVVFQLNSIYWSLSNKSEKDGKKVTFMLYLGGKKGAKLLKKVSYHKYDSANIIEKDGKKVAFMI